MLLLTATMPNPLFATRKNRSKPCFAENYILRFAAISRAVGRNEFFPMLDSYFFRHATRAFMGDLEHIGFYRFGRDFRPFEYLYIMSTI